MKALQLAAPKSFRPFDAPEPSKPAAGEALIRTSRMGICGTDVSCYLGKFPFFDYPHPRPRTGRGSARGWRRRIQRPARGSLLGRTLLELRGMPCLLQRSGNCCENLKVFGVMMDGGLCERSIIRADKLHPSDKLSFEQLALVETLAIGCHASDRGNPKTGEHALVIGAGPIGLATLEFNRLTGAEVTVMDMSEERLDFAAGLMESKTSFHSRETVRNSKNAGKSPRGTSLTP